MVPYSYTRRSLRDIQAARCWYDAQGIDLGNRFVDAVLLAIRAAREHPQRYPEREPGVRAIGCEGFPSRVYYEPRQDEIVVRAVYHTARDPDRWDDPNRD